jgi:hypothetical protein
MTYTITSTTDGKYLGHIIEISMQGEVNLGDVTITFDSMIGLGNKSHRLCNSNYIMDIKEN